MANLVDELIQAIKPKKDERNRTYSATVSKIDSEGTVWVYVAGSDRETPTASAASEVKKGDSVNVEWRNNKLYIAGNYSNPSAGVTRVRNVENVSANNTKIIQAQEASIVNLQVSKADIGELTAAEARIGELEADHVSTDDLDAATARISTLEADNVTVNGKITAAEGRISDLEADHVSTSDLTAVNASITNLQTNKANVTDLNAATGRITNLETNALTAESAVITDLQSDTAKIHNLTANQLSAATGYIGSLNSENITVNDLKAVKATVNDLDANYAQIDLANVNNAWIQNGVVKDASIADAKIIGMSANKLTAGTIDASNITVTNLNADNITAGSISVDGITIDVTNNEASIDGSYIENGTITLNGLAQEVTDKIEGAIETWTGSTVPTLNNYPAIDWNTNQLKKNHVGDVYYVINAGNQADGYCYRFANTGTTANPSYGWILIKDSDVTAALQRLIDAEGDIDDLQSFESTTSSWITETDEELSSIKTNHTSLVAVVDKTIVSTTQLWYTKANTTAPSKPTAHVTSTSTAGNAWRTVVPAYNSSYPNYFYCYEWQYADGTYGWSDVTRDIGMGETQSTARTASTNASTALTNAATAQSAAEGAQSTANTAVTNAATAQTTANTANTNAQAAQNTANANIKSTVQLWFTKANTTAPSKPTAHVTTNNASTANAWNIAVPTYNATYPNYFYCYEYQKGDNTYSWSDVVLDRATTENQANARSALSQVATKVETSVFNTVSQQVDTNTANITSLSNTVETKADSSTVTTLSNTVNSVQQTANSNTSKISNLTTRLGTNADGTASTNDIVAKEAALEQDLSGFKTTVSSTYATQANLNTEINQRKAMYGTCSIAAGTAAKTVTCANFSLYTGARIAVTFSNANTATTPTLNVNGTGAKTIRSYSGAALSEAEYKWSAGSTLEFVYDGTYWRLADEGTLKRLTAAEGTISSHTTAIEQNANAIALKANATDVYTKTQTDGLITTEVENRNAAITASADAINLSVSQNYTTKTEFNNLEIGGRNLFLGTLSPVVSPTASRPRLIEQITDTMIDGTPDVATHGIRSTANNDTGRPIIQFGSATVSTGVLNGLIPGETYTWSFDTDYKIYSNNTTTATKYYRAYCYCNKASATAFNAVAYIDIRKYEASDSSVWGTEFKDQRVEFTFTVPTSVTMAYLIVMPNTSGMCSSGDYIEIRNLKLEKSNRATDWTPAPEDLEAYTDNAVSAAKTEIKATTDGISTEVSKISSVKYATCTASSYTLSQIKTWAAEGYNTYFDVTSTSDIRVGDTVYIKIKDATRDCWVFLKFTVTAVNSTTRISGTSHGYEDVLPVETIKSTINQSADSVKIAANHVDIEGAAIFSSGRLSTTSLNNAYDAKGAADTAVANLEIGGRNLLRNSMLRTTGTVSGITFTESSLGDEYINISGTTTAAVSQWIADLRNITCTNTAVTISANFVPSSPCYFQVSTSKNNTWYKDYNKITWYSNTQCYLTINLEDGETLRYLRIVLPSTGISFNGDYRFKVELGTKQTDWTPAPEDLNVQEQRIYYKTTATTAPAAPTTWVTSTATAALTWTTKRMPYDQTNKYLYTCTQRQAVGGGITNSTVLLDDTTTVIDGGNIITGTVTANKLNADNINASGALTVGALSSAAQSQVLNSEIEVGGRNLAKGTNVTRTWTSAGNYYGDSKICNDIAEGTTITISLRVDADDVVWGSNTYQRVGCEFSIAKTAGGTQYIGAGAGKALNDSANIVEAFTGSFHGRISKTFTLLGNISASNNTTIYTYAQNFTSGTVKISNIKLEIGNKATDWTPAPEDVDAGISDAAKTATNYIVADSNGLMVADMSGGSQTPSTATSKNVLIDSDSLDIRDGQTVLATFGAGGVQIGKNSKSRAIIDNHSFQMYYGSETDPYVHLSDFRDDNGYATLTDTFIGDGQHSAYTTGYTVYSITSVTVDGAVVNYIISDDEESSSGGSVLSPKEITLTDGEHDVNLANGSVLKITYTTTDEVKAFTFGDRVGSGDSIGNYSMTVGVANGASGQKAFSQGVDCHASGLYTFASGHMCHANGEFSHAEGNVAIANGNCSHAEGCNTKTGGFASHSEGYYTDASGYSSHAEGRNTTASGYYSHAQNNHTVATQDNQTVIGKYNKATVSGSGTDADPYVYTNVGNYAFIIGNGTSNTTAARSNALTVDWNGGIEMDLDVDSSASSSTAATSGTDMDLFNAIINLSWYSDVIT